MTATKHTKKPKLLSHGRPKSFKPAASLTSKATRTIIRTHHTLSKQHAKALQEHDIATVAKLAEEIEANGGLNVYQKASLTGQKNDRGGDSSKVLMEWLASLRSEAMGGEKNKLKMLEVGALSTNNACSRSGWFEMKCIDLNSQEEDKIEEQDFMERPIPKVDDERFDIISLSLVLNYVPDPAGRGEMLRRTLKFLRHPSGEGTMQEYFPSLFLVLPAPCVENSRYLDEDKLEAIMNSMGYVKVKRKMTTKLVYYLWRREGKVEVGKITFKKMEIRSGKTRNNFAIVLKSFGSSVA